MGLSLGTVVDVAFGSRLLGLATVNGTPLSAAGVPDVWIYGALTLALALSCALWSPLRGRTGRPYIAPASRAHPREDGS